VAETSLTIDGITLVIDSGLARLADFDARRGIDALTIQKISRASAEQRAGRAGRTAPGTCIRLWSEADHAGRRAQTIPEIHRMDLSEALLTLAASGIEDLDAFEWFERPDEKGLRRGRDLLVDLGALDRQTGRLTDLGRQMAQLPVTPRYARVLLEASRLGCYDSMAEIVALTQGKILWTRRGKVPENVRPRRRPLRFSAPAARPRQGAGLPLPSPNLRRPGHPRRLRPWIDRLAFLLQRLGPGDDDTTLTGPLVAHCLLTGFPDQVGKRLNRSNRACAFVGGRRGQISDDSIVNGGAISSSPQRSPKSRARTSMSSSTSTPQ